MNDVDRARLVVQECALEYLKQRMEAIEARLAEIEAEARISATADVVAIVKAELERGYDDSATEALYRVLMQLEGENNGKRI